MNEQQSSQPTAQTSNTSLWATIPLILLAALMLLFLLARFTPFGDTVKHALRRDNSKESAIALAEDLMIQHFVNDPESFEKVEAVAYEEPSKKGNWMVTMTYRAKNGFGAKTLGEIEMLVDLPHRKGQIIPRE